MNRREFTRNVALAAGAALLPLSGVSVLRAQEPKRLVFLTPFGYSLAFAPVIYAVARGLFEEEGIEVHVEGGRGAAQAIQLVAAGQAQVGRTGGANYMMARVDSNAPVLAFATIAQQSPFFFISRKATPAESAKDLVGKTVGLASLGGSMEATLDLMLMREGIDAKEVRRERVADTPATFGLIEAGRIDGFFGNVSTVTRLRVEGYDISTYKVDDGVPGQVYVADEAALADDRATYVSFLRAAHRAIGELAAMDDAGLQEAVALMRGEYDITGSDQPAMAVADLRGNMDLWLTNGVERALRNDEKLWSGAEALLRSGGLLKATTDKPLYTNEIWEAAIA